VTRYDDAATRREVFALAGARPRAVALAAALAALALAGSAGAARAGPDSRRVELATADGGTALASEWGSGARGVVLVHGAIFDRASWDPLARRLAAAGHRVLAVDLRRNAERELLDERALRLDVEAAVLALRRSGAARVALVGASLGGRVAGDWAASAGADAVERIALLAPAGLQEPERLPGRKLVVLSRDEPSAARVRELFGRLPEPKRLVELEGSAHAQHVFATPQAARLTEVLVQFLGEGDARGRGR
jgi:dienelactone hydrolase